MFTTHTPRQTHENAPRIACNHGKENTRATSTDAPQAIGGEKKRDKIIKSFLDRGIIAQADKWVRDSDGKKRKLGGKHYMVGTPEKVKKYADELNTLDL